jgi:hypothetical protein
VGIDNGHDDASSAPRWWPFIDPFRDGKHRAPPGDGWHDSAVEFLAVAQMPSRWSRSPIRILLRRAYRPPRAWHAVAPDESEPVSLCGYRYTRELHRTWNQPMVGRRCRPCEDLVAEAERRHHLRGPLWASPWSPEGAGVDATTVMRVGQDRASSHAYRHGNGANSGTGRAVAVTTVNGAPAESEHAFLGVPAAEPAPEAPPAPWVGRVIRRNGILPSDVARL